MNSISMLMNSFVVVILLLFSTTLIAFRIIQHFPSYKAQQQPFHTTMTTTTMTTHSSSVQINAPTNKVGNDTIIIIKKPTEAQLLVWQRQIKLCGNNVTKGIQLLRQFISISIRTTTTTKSSNINNNQTVVTISNDDDDDESDCYYTIFESLYLETLGVIGRAKRSNPKSMFILNEATTSIIPSSTLSISDIFGNNNNNNTNIVVFESLDIIQQIAIQLYIECPTDTIRARTISICNTATSTTVQQQSNIKMIAIQLLLSHPSSSSSSSSPPSIASYHAALAACAIAKDDIYALHLLQYEMPKQNNNNNNTITTTTLSYNILFTALYRANKGYRALDILQQMIHQQQQDESSSLNSSNNTLETLTHLPPPDLNTFHLTIKALIATTTTATSKNGTTTGSNQHHHLDTAYSVLNIMIDYDHWYSNNHDQNQYSSLTDTKQPVVLRPNTVTFDLLIQAYSRYGIWYKVKFIEMIQSQYTAITTIKNTEYSTNTSSSSSLYDSPKFVFPNLPTAVDSTSHHESTTTSTPAKRDSTHVPLDDKSMDDSAVIPISLSSSTSSYFSSSIRLQWEQVGIKKLKNEKYWMIGTYIDPIQGYDFIVALQPHRNPIKNGIKILLYNNNNNKNDNTTIGTTKVGYLLMINQPASAMQDLTNNKKVNDARSGSGTSTLLGVYLDPSYRQGGLSKVMIAIWLQLCYKANAIPRTGIMNKPLLVLVLQHTFHFVPEVTNGSNGVNVEVSLVSNATTNKASSAIGIYSSNIKCLQGVFSLRDIRRENIELLREPSSPRRGRSCQIGATFVVSATTIGTNMTDIVEQQLLGKSQSGQLIHSSNNLSWGNVFFGYNEPQ